MTERGGVCLLGLDGEVLYCDDKFERSLGVEVLRGARLAELTSWLNGLTPDARGTFMDRRVKVTVIPTGLPHVAAVVQSQLRMVTPAFGLVRDLEVTRRTLSSILDSAPISIITMDMQKKGDDVERRSDQHVRLDAERSARAGLPAGGGGGRRGV